MEEQTTNAVIQSADDSFGLPILGKSIWAGKT